MKIALYLVSFLFLISCSHQEVAPSAARVVASTQSQNDVEGIWSLQGSNSVRGPYTGEVELRRGNDGTYNVIRIVSYISFYFEGLRVQEIWTGKAVPNKEGMVISYELSDADFVTEVSGVKRKAASFKNKTVVNEFFRLNAKDFLEASFSDKTSASYQEWMATKRPLEAQPIWMNQRTKIQANGQKNLSPALSASLKSFKSQLNFEKNSFIQSFAKKPEFKNMQAYVISDPTDYEFYQKNNDRLRVENKPIDSISLVEAMLRRNAYVYTLQQKAALYEKNLHGRHINEQGLISPVKTEEGGTIKYPPSEDIGFLTAMYVASQSMRYQQTKESEALENIKKFLPALFNALDNSSGQGKDFLPAVKHAFVWASLSLPKTEAALWNKLREKSQLMLTQVKELEHPSDRASYLALDAYLNSDPQKVQSVKALYQEKLKDHSREHFYWKGSANWDLAFWATIDDMTDLMLMDFLELKDTREALQKQVLDRWVIYGPAQRHLQTLLAFGWAFNKGVKSESFKRESSDAKMRAAVDSAIWGLRQMPQPRPFFDLAYDHSLNPDWSVSPVPKGFWNYKKGSKPEIETTFQGLYEYPLFEDKSFDSPFVWREDAFGFKGSTSKAIEHTGVDYLYAYWLAQYVSAIAGSNP